MNVLKKISKGLNQAALVFDGVLLIAMFGLTIVNVFLRKFFDINILWQYDVLRVLFVGFVFISASIVTYNDQHVRFVFISNRLPMAFKRFESILENFASILFSGVIFYFGVRLTMSVSNQKMPASGISASLLYVLLVVSMVIMGFHCIVKLVDAITGHVEVEKDGGSSI